MKEKILNNFSLKILSAICAIILWVVIVNVYDPTYKITVSGVTVQLINEDTLSDKGYAYEVIDGSKISVYITGPRSVVSNIGASDIIATCDLSKVSAYSDYVDIDTKIGKEGVNTSSLEIIPKTTAIKLSIENRVSKTYDVEVEYSGQPANGYVISDTQVSPSTIKVTGSASAIENISNIKAIYDPSGATFDINDNADLVLFDGNGNVIDDGKLQLSKNQVEIRATLKPTKNVPVEFEIGGVITDGYKLAGSYANLSSVDVYGTADALKNLTKIEIPEGVINIDGITSGKSYSINLSEYMPSGIKLVNSVSYVVTLVIEPVGTKTVAIDVNTIKVNNLNDGLTVSFGDTTSISVVLNGISEKIAPVTSDMLNPSIDLNQMTVGTYQVPLTLAASADYTVNQTYSINVVIEQKTESQQPTSADTSSSSAQSVSASN